MQIRLIVCGSDLNLLGTRQQVLQTAGFDVLAAASPDEILPLVQDHPITALVLCHTLTFEQQLRAIMTLRRYRPATKVIVLTKYGDGTVPEGANASFDISEGPKALIHKIEQMLKPLHSRQQTV